MITSVEVEKRSSNYNAHSLFKKRKLRGKIEIFLNLLKHNYKNKQLKLKKKKIVMNSSCFLLKTRTRQVCPFFTVALVSPGWS